ncbi:MAG: iron ABC transporter permease [Deltaproteobacteria bacterium]|nr:iron ABC transporter permease [Deltaproteobacteria bacterium]
MSWKNDSPKFSTFQDELSPPRTGRRFGSLFTVKGRRFLFFSALLLFTLFLSLWSLSLGAINCSLGDVIKSLVFPQKDSDLAFMIWNLRLPRVTAALAVGAILALNGAILQNVLVNPLASSFTLGLSQGAAFGASFALIMLPESNWVPLQTSLVAGCAFCGAMLTSLLVMSFTLLKGMTPQTLILAGVAISTLLGACTMALQFTATESQVVSTLFWTFGDLSRGAWNESLIEIVSFFLGLFVALRFGWDYDALKWGDTQALSLGVNTKRVRMVSFFLTALTTATATAFFGVIGFVGLIAPHMIRLIFPLTGHYFLLPTAALFGACFLVGADLLAQNLFYPLVIPIGIICSFAGVPMFLFLIFRQSMRYV